MNDKTPLEYSKPTVSDYGDLQELTAQNQFGSSTDVPLGFPVPPFSIFT